MPKIIDLTNMEFGQWCVLDFCFTNKYGHVYWWCICTCGTIAVVRSDKLISGHSTKCKKCSGKKGGNIENIIKGKKWNHSIRQHKSEYYSWKSMIRRCYDEKDNFYKNYGGRGIFVSDEWIESFDAFIEDVGVRPGSGYSLERIDNNKGYVRDNVVWANNHDQSRNKKSNVWIDVNGERMILKDFINKIGVVNSTYHKWKKKGLSIDEMIERAKVLNSIPVRKNITTNVK